MIEAITPLPRSRTREDLNENPACCNRFFYSIKLKFLLFANLFPLTETIQMVHLAGQQPIKIDFFDKTNNGILQPNYFQ
tara:strand:+ start:170 stop:406 length:237 start_codon:yes stop_codon:yes gene_type:complete